MSLHLPFSDAENEAGRSTTLGRRAALGYLGAAAGAATLALAGCANDVDTLTIGSSKSDVNLGTGNTGVFNYLYALEQLSAAFYIQVLAKTASSIFQSGEQDAFQRIGQHKAIHRDLLKATIVQHTLASPIRVLSLNFASIDFTQRSTASGVLQAAQRFADWGVAAYNGIGSSFQGSDAPEFILLASKMASVGARHAAYLRDQLSPGSMTSFFAGDDQVDPTTGLDKALTPTETLALIQPYVINRLLLS